MSVLVVSLDWLFTLVSCELFVWLIVVNLWVFFWGVNFGCC